MEVFKTFFFNIVTTQYDHPSYLKQILGRIYMFFTLFGYWVGGRGAPKGLVHNLLMRLFILDSSKMEVFKTCFFDILTTHYDHPSYLKHILGRIYMFFTLFGYWVGGGGGGSQGNGTQPAYAVFHPGQLKNGSFQNLFF